MKNLMSKMFVNRKVAGLMLALLMTVNVPFAALAADNVARWTTIGSAGIADEAAQGLVDNNSGIVSLASSAPVGTTAVLRYNVDSLAGNYRALSGLTVRYRDNDANAQVIVRFRQYNLNTGADTLLMEFDSNQFPQNALFQKQSIGRVVTQEFEWFTIDFSNYAYYVEVTLKKTGASGSPSLGIAQLYSLY